MAAVARDRGVSDLFIPAHDAPEAALVPNLNVYPIETNLKTLPILGDGEFNGG